MKHILLSLLLLLVTGSSVTAQQNMRERERERERERDGASIAGTVLDAVTGEPLGFATVVIQGTTLAAVADEKGAFVDRKSVV